LIKIAGGEEGITEHEPAGKSEEEKAEELFETEIKEPKLNEELVKELKKIAVALSKNN
jgi:hypothetical protein